MSEPMVSHDLRCVLFIGARGQKTLSGRQSGQGADEVFGGITGTRPATGVRSGRILSGRVFDRSYEGNTLTVNPQWQVPDHAEAFLGAEFGNGLATGPVDKACAWIPLLCWWMIRLSGWIT